MKIIKKLFKPALFIMFIALSFIGVNYYNNDLASSQKSKTYSKSLIKDFTQSVIDEVKEDSFSYPFNSSTVEVLVGYYESTASSEEQEKSLITYAKTYMPSSGVIYGSSNVFNILSTYDGTVSKIEHDEVLGNYIEVKHNNNLSTVYYGIEEILFDVGDEIKQGTILGTSTINIIEEKYTVFFEVYYQGKNINPQVFLEADPKNYL